MQARKKRRKNPPLSFGWDTSKLQKITLFQAHRSAPLQRTTVRIGLCIGRASFEF